MHIGILTSGGDCPGLNAAIRAVCRAGRERYGMHIVGFRDGFRGLVQDHTADLDDRSLSGILTNGGTVLGTSRDKPHAMLIGSSERNMIPAAVATYRRHGLDGLVCIGGGGTQKNALRLAEAGLNIITLPKTIDNDVALTDTSIGFDTALATATEAIDRLHSTAMSHGRVIVVELMGHRAGWLTLAAGLAGGADVIIIPEIPYQLASIATAVRRRHRAGRNFSIIAVAEGAMSETQAAQVAKLIAAKESAKSGSAKRKASRQLQDFHDGHVGHTLELTRSIEQECGLESRLTILGHLQRGGTPSAGDRVLATRLGTACVEFLHRKMFGVMIAARGEGTDAVPLERVAGQKKLVPVDHHLLSAARSLGLCVGVC